MGETTAKPAGAIIMFTMEPVWVSVPPKEIMFALAKLAVEDRLYPPVASVTAEGSSEPLRPSLFKSAKTVAPFT